MALAGTIYLFEDARATSPKEVTPFKYFRQNLQTYAQLGRIRTYNANDVSLQVDSIDKTVVVSRQQLNAQPEFLESLLRDTANFKARSLNDENGLKVIEFINAQTPNIKACRIYYTPGTYELRHCTIEWWKDGAGEEATDTSVWITKIDYTGWACDMDVEKEIHDILSFDGRDPQLRTSYTGYQLTIL